jgi:hypothetical protein
MPDKTLEQFIEEHRAEIDAAIAGALKMDANPIPTDRERRMWILNDEGLYWWARAEGRQNMNRKTTTLGQHMQEQKPKTVWLGEARLIDYPVVIVAESKREAQEKLIAEHRRVHTGQAGGAKNWDDLVDKTEAQVRQIAMGVVTWP